MRGCTRYRVAYAKRLRLLVQLKGRWRCYMWTPRNKEAPNVSTSRSTSCESLASYPLLLPPSALPISWTCRHMDALTLIISMTRSHADKPVTISSMTVAQGDNEHKDLVSTGTAGGRSPSPRNAVYCVRSGLVSCHFHLHLHLTPVHAYPCYGLWIRHVLEVYLGVFR